MNTKRIISIFSVLIALFILIWIAICIHADTIHVSAFDRLIDENFKLKNKKTEIIWPERGKIYDCKGRTIATNRPIWDVHLDCTILDVTCEEWESLSLDLSKELEAILGEKKAYEYYQLLIDGRTDQKQYLTICKNVEDSVANKLMKAPLLKMGQFEGGAIFERFDARSYPYGNLGRRIIGYFQSKTQCVGLEGSYNNLLYGETGKAEYVRKCRKGRYYWKEKSKVDPAHGQDLMTTLDMDMMSVVDAELRTAIEGRKDVKSACAVLMETKNGAVRAMVNLMSGEKGDTYDEAFNLAIGNEYEPGNILIDLPVEILENGLKDAKFDIEGLRNTHYSLDEKGAVNVSCTPLHVLRIFGGVANGGVMFDPYLATASSPKYLCPPAVADSLKSVLKDGCHSTATVPHPSINGSDPYRYPSGDCEFATTWCGTVNAGGVEYALLCVVFSKPTKDNAPQRDIPCHFIRNLQNYIK